MKKLSLYLCILFAVNAVNSQSVGIGTNNPSGKFHISNSPSGSDALFFVDINGNVGVGTKMPQAKLDVAGILLAQNARITRTLPGTHPFQVVSYLSLIDQQQNLGNTVYDHPIPGWQSFTAGTTGILDSIELSFLALGPSSGVRTLTIYSGNGVNGPQLSTTSFNPVAGSTIASAYLNVSVVVGNEYTIRLSSQRGWAYFPSDVYSGGSPDSFIDGDRSFKTYITGLESLLKVDNNGNIGIGTNNVTEKLVIKTTDDKYGIIHTNGSISFGTFVGGTSVYGGWIGTKSDHPLMFFTNNGSAQMTLMQNGNLGIGTVTPTYKLQVSGIIAANDFVSMSDARLKKDIVPLSNALSTVLQLNGVTYYWKGESYPQYQFDSKHKIGFLAQEVEKVMPELVATGTDGYKTVNYIEVVPLLVESIKQQQQQIEELKRMVKKLIKSNR